MLRYTESERHSLAQLENLRIRTPAGDEVPLGLVATIEREAGFATVTRVQGRRQISVLANMPDEENEQEIMDDLLLRHGKRLEQTYGVTIKLGDEVAERQDSMDSMMIGGTFAVLVIFLIMASIFRSYLQPVLILFSIPVGVAGAFLAHGCLGLSVSIMSFFGLVALLGVAVNDAIVFIVAVNERIADRMPLFVAVREAGKRRFRAILLTSATTFVGLFPMILETSFQAKFLIPMAVSIAFGVAAATIGTLVLIPCLLGVLSDARCFAYYLRHLRFPATRESVEPSANVGKL
jgi:multidrug efflux pump subunit AcrB